MPLTPLFLGKQALAEDQPVYWRPSTPLLSLLTLSLLSFTPPQAPQALTLHRLGGFLPLSPLLLSNPSQDSVFAQARYVKMCSVRPTDNIWGGRAGGQGKSLLKTKLFLRNSATVSQYSLSQNESKRSNTARIALLSPLAQYSLWEEGRQKGQGGMKGEKEVSSLDDLWHKISFLAGLISIYSTKMELLYGTLHIRQEIIDSLSIREKFYFYFF